jgi:hypothetical protein
MLEQELQALVDALRLPWVNRILVPASGRCMKCRKVWDAADRRRLLLAADEM